MMKSLAVPFLLCYRDPFSRQTRTIQLREGDITPTTVALVEKVPESHGFVEGKNVGGHTDPT